MMLMDSRVVLVLSVHEGSMQNKIKVDIRKNLSHWFNFLMVENFKNYANIIKLIKGISSYLL